MHMPQETAKGTETHGRHQQEQVSTVLWLPDTRSLPCSGSAKKGKDKTASVQQSVVATNTSGSQLMCGVALAEEQASKYLSYVGVAGGIVSTYSWSPHTREHEHEQQGAFLRRRQDHD